MQITEEAAGAAQIQAAEMPEGGSSEEMALLAFGPEAAAAAQGFGAAAAAVQVRAHPQAAAAAAGLHIPMQMGAQCPIGIGIGLQTRQPLTGNTLSIVSGIYMKTM